MRYITLSKEEVIYWHDEIINSNELPGLNPGTSLEAALYRIENKLNYEPDTVRDVFDVAALYALAIGKAHAFRDCNKRTSLQCAVIILELNQVFSHRLAAPILSQLAFKTVELVTGEITCRQFAAFLRENLAVDVQ